MSHPDQNGPTTVEPDYDRLLRTNLERVFNERDALRRDEAVEEIFIDEPVMFEPDNIVTGRAAISAVAGALLENFGPTFRFVPAGPALGHHGLGLLRWQAGPADGPVVVTGADVVEIVDGRIARLWVMLNAPGA
jgi:hypothetical protein